MKTEAELRNQVLSEVRQIATHLLPEAETDRIPIVFTSLGSSRDSYMLTVTLEEFDKIAEILLPPCTEIGVLSKDLAYGNNPYWEVMCDQRAGHLLEHHAVVKRGTLTAEFKWTGPNPS